MVTGGDMTWRHSDVQGQHRPGDRAGARQHRLDGRRKLTNLDRGANFVNTLSAAAAYNTDPNAVKISLVPFSQTVRVGSTTATTWIDQTGASPINDEIFTTATGTQRQPFHLLSTWGPPGRAAWRTARTYDIRTPRQPRGRPVPPYFAPDGRTSIGNDNNYLSDVSGSSSWKVRQGVVTKYVSTSGLSSSKGPNEGCGMQTLRRLTTDWSR